MVILLRRLIIGLIVIAVLAYIAGFAVSDMVIAEVRPALTTHLVNTHYTGVEDAKLDYRYDAVVRFNPPRVEVRDFYITSHALNVDDSLFNESHLQIESVDIELLPLLREDELRIVSIDGVRFLGLLPDEELEDRLMENNGNLEDVQVSNYHGRFRLRATFATIGVRTHTLVGDWAVTDDGVIDVINREHYGPYGRVSGTVADQMDSEYDFSVRIHVHGKELDGQNVLWTDQGLWLVAADHDVTDGIPEDE